MEGGLPGHWLATLTSPLSTFQGKPEHAEPGRAPPSLSRAWPLGPVLSRLPACPWGGATWCQLRPRVARPHHAGPLIRAAVSPDGEHGLRGDTAMPGGGLAGARE